MSTPVQANAGEQPVRYFPGALVLFVVVLSIVGIVVIRSWDVTGDYAVTNLLTLIFGFLVVATLYGWFLLRSSYPRTLRLLSLGALLLGVPLLGLVFEIEGVSGSMIPKWKWRFAPRHDATLDKPIAVAPSQLTEDQVETSAKLPDFGQFLGPDRNAVIRDVQLERDWAKHPPREVWRQPIGAGWSAFAAVNGLAVTLEQRGEEEYVTCYDVLTGELRWSHGEAGRHETTLGGIGPRSTPTIHNGRVYTQGAFGIVLCLEAMTGNVIWRVDLYELFGTDKRQDLELVAWGRAGSPLIVDDLVVVPAGGPKGKAVSLVALKQTDGSIAWQAGATQVSYASPALATLAGVRQILSVNENNVTGHDPTTGKILWEAPWKGNSSADASASQPLTPGDDWILLSKGYNAGSKLLKLAAAPDGTLATNLEWADPTILKTKFTNAAIVEGYIYALSDGILECIELKTGDTKWKGKRRRGGDYGQGQILAVGDVILVQAEQGDVVMVEASPQALNELARFPMLHGQTWNNLCLYGPYLLVRNAEEAACFELKLKQTGPAAADAARSETPATDAPSGD